MNGFGNAQVTLADDPRTVATDGDVSSSGDPTPQATEPTGGGCLPAIAPHQKNSPVAKRPGRPRGLGKVPGSGRKKGSPNRLTSEVRSYILNEGRILERLFKIARGLKVRHLRPDGEVAYTVPPLNDQLRALLGLLDRAVPSLKSSTSEISGPGGGPIRHETKSARELLIAKLEGMAVRIARTPLAAPTNEGDRTP